MYSVCAEFQKAFPDKLVAYIDSEQCLAKGTRIYNADTKTNSNIEDLVGTEFHVLSSSKDNKIIKQKATAIYKGKELVYKLSASRGHSIEATDSHLFLTQDGYKELKDIKIGDTLYTPKNLVQEQKDNLNKRDQDLYRLLGLHLGDGTINQASISDIDPLIIEDIKNIVETHLDSTISIDNTNIRIINKTQGYKLKNKEEIKKLFLEEKYTLSELATCYGLSLKTLKDLLIRAEIVNEGYDFRKHSVETRIKGSTRPLLKPKVNQVKQRASQAYYFLKTFPTFSLYAKDKYIPSNLTLSQLAQVLAGYFMADGTVSTSESKLCFSMSTSSFKLASDLKTSLLRFGITSQTYEYNKKKEDGSYYNTCYIITSSGSDNASKFLEHIPIYSYKKNNLVSALNNCKGTMDRRKYLGDLICLEVTGIEEMGVKPVYDISVANMDFLERNFIANGIITHNCVSLEYMSQFGVNVEELEFQQPETAEEALEIINAYAETGVFSLIILDSIASMQTKAQLERSLEDKTMGALANVLTVGLTKIKTTCKRTDTTLFMVNQVRDKISKDFKHNATT